MREQLFVKLVAIGGDLGQQRGERDVGVVATGAVAGGAGGHQDRAGEHGGRFEQQLLARRGGDGRCPRPLAAVERIQARGEGVERDLLQHEAAVVAAIVDEVLIPLAEVVVGALAGRVIELVGPRVERQFVDECRIEPGLLANLGIGLRQNVERLPDQRLVGPAGRADILDIERNRPHALVRIGLDLLLRFEHRDRPIADVVVELFERAGDDSLGFLPRRALRDSRFERAAEEQRPPQFAVRLMPEQIAMELAVGGQQMSAEQRDDRAGLADVAEGGRLLLQLIDPLQEPIAEDGHRVAG